MAGENSDAPWKTDVMDRKGVSEFLTKYLDDSHKVKVLNVNSGWGSGKTYFLNEWKKQEESERVCVYFDAWKHDYTGDPFISLVAAIKDQLESQIHKNPEIRQTIKAFTKGAAKTLLAATPIIAKGLVKKATGIAGDDVVEVTQEAFGGVAEKAVENLINSKKKAIQSVSEFKIVFSKLLAEASDAKGSGDKPAYIFIDELDRCRPTFAIELLERIKHLFDIDGCRFVIATDTKQLSFAITAVYGQSFESHKYLKRFFDAEFKLDNSRMEKWVKQLFQNENYDVLESTGLSFHHENRRTNIRAETFVNPDLMTIRMGDKRNALGARQAIFLAMIKTFSPQLRELEKLADRVETLEKHAQDGNKEFHFTWAIYLLFLKDSDVDLYTMAMEGDYNLALEQIQKKYPGYRLHFGDSIPTVHEIFQKYLVNYREGDEFVKNALQRQRGKSYMDTINYASSVRREHMETIARLVDLTHRLN